MSCNCCIVRFFITDSQLLFRFSRSDNSTSPDAAAEHPQHLGHGHHVLHEPHLLRRDTARSSHGAEQAVLDVRGAQPLA